MVQMTTARLDPQQIEAAVAHTGAGAILTFSGVVRDNFGDRPVTGLTYEAYGGMAEAEMERICAEITARWRDVRVAIVHRIGHLVLGEISVVIAVSSPHRDAAYQASRVAIDQLKARVPIWKKEHYADTDAQWKANADSCEPAEPR